VAKKKLIHFGENLTFPHLFQPKYHDLIPEFRMRGQWHQQFFQNNQPLIVEFGCGKGEYTVGLAEAYPDKNFIGIDLKGARLWRGCKTVAEQQMKNVGFIRTLVDHVERVFSPGEVSGIWITFPDPQPKKERRRLTAPVFLEKYRNILTPDGIIHLKTDDQDFFQYTLDVIIERGHRLLWSSNDLYNSGSTDDVTRIRTFYERMWLDMGKKICYLRFQLRQPD
jgi:tRNA (guanine-N7-)-methyltransferase